MVSILFTCLILLHMVGSSKFPTPNSSANRVLGMILCYNYGHIDPIMLILSEYQSMCEGGWDPTVAFFTTVSFTPNMFRYLKRKTFCYRTNSSIPIEVSIHKPTIGTALAAEHRSYMGGKINYYDVFIYHEDDIVVKHTHLVAYLKETLLLQQLMPDRGIYDHTIGFQRYRKIFRGNIHEVYHDQDIFEQELLEEMPSFNRICLKDTPYLVVGGNIHQAMWILTQEQIYVLQGKCSFLNQSSASREYMSSFSLFERKGGHCGLTKLIPADKLFIFSVLHYYHQRHIQWTSVFLADENIRAGYHYYSVPKVAENIPTCWKELVDRSQLEQNPPTFSPTIMTESIPDWN